MTPPRRRKRVWTISDFAQHLEGPDTVVDDAARRRALRFLQRIEKKHGLSLLIPTVGTNRGFTFVPAVLHKLEPELFSPVDSLEFRLEELEDQVGEMKMEQATIVDHTKRNARAIAKMRLQLRLPL